jgi:hypothetical protein
MNDQRRRFKPRPQRSGFRGRSNNRGPNNNGHFQSNGNGNIGRGNGSMTNPFNVEKSVQKYLQLAKEATSSGDPVLNENYLQHAEHYSRRLAELNGKPKETKIVNNTENNSTTTVDSDKATTSNLEKKI